VIAGSRCDETRVRSSRRIDLSGNKMMSRGTAEQRLISNQQRAYRPRASCCSWVGKQTREARIENGSPALRMHRVDLEGNVMRSVAIIAR